jgi:hypothetical protein
MDQPDMGVVTGALTTLRDQAELAQNMPNVAGDIQQLERGMADLRARIQNM